MKKLGALGSIKQTLSPAMCGDYRDLVGSKEPQNKSVLDT